MAYDTSKVNTWKRNDTFSKPTGINALIEASPALTSTPKSTSTENILVGPPTPKPVQSYTSSTTSGSYSGGTPESIITDSLSQMLDAYNQAAESTKGTAKSTYDQKLKNLDEALRQAEDTYNRGVERAKTTYKTGKKRAIKTFITGALRENQSYENKRSDLLESLKRFQDENAENVANQKKAYLANQAALESARAEADRQNRISAAARGLGGSGLQQLAQVQNLLSQSQDISDLATENQSAMNKLSTALANYESDTNKDIQRALEARNNALSDLLTNKDTTLSDLETARDTTLGDLESYLTNAQTARTLGRETALENYNNTLKEIDAALAQNKANANWDYGTTLSNILSRYSSGGSSASSDLDLIVGGLQANQQDFENALSDLNKMTDKQVEDTYGKGVTKEEAAQSLYNTYLASSNDYLRNYGNKYINQTNISANNLKNILNNYGY